MTQVRRLQGLRSLCLIGQATAAVKRTVAASALQQVSTQVGTVKAQGRANAAVQGLALTATSTAPTVQAAATVQALPVSAKLQVQLYKARPRRHQQGISSAPRVQPSDRAVG